MTLSTDDIFEDLRAISDQLDIDLEDVQVGPGVSLEDDLGMDSLAQMDFLVFLERKYLVSIPNDQLDDMATIGEVAHTVNRLVLANASPEGAVA